MCSGMRSRGGIGDEPRTTTTLRNSSSIAAPTCGSSAPSPEMTPRRNHRGPSTPTKRAIRFTGGWPGPACAGICASSSGPKTPSTTRVVPPWDRICCSICSRISCHSPLERGAANGCTCRLEFAKSSPTATTRPVPSSTSRRRPRPSRGGIFTPPRSTYGRTAFASCDVERPVVSRSAGADFGLGSGPVSSSVTAPPFQLLALPAHVPASLSRRRSIRTRARRDGCRAGCTTGTNATSGSGSTSSCAIRSPTATSYEVVGVRVEERHPDLAAVARVDEPRRVHDRDAVLRGEAAARQHQRGGAGGQRDPQPGADGRARRRREGHRLGRTEVGGGVAGDRPLGHGPVDQHLDHEGRG